MAWTSFSTGKKKKAKPKKNSRIFKIPIFIYFVHIYTHTYKRMYMNEEKKSLQREEMGSQGKVE